MNRTSDPTDSSDPTGSGRSAASLRVRDVSHSYGAQPVLRGVNLEVRAGTVCAILGPNGAGKSTLASAIAGAVEVSAGTVIVDGSDVTALSRHARVRRGVEYVSSDGAVFPGLTVAENLLVGHGDSSRLDRRATLERAAAMFPFLAARWDERAGVLSGGEQQMVALSRVLANRAALIVIDELSHGLSPAIAEQLFGVLADRRGETTVVLIEQFVRRAYAIADQVVVMSHGEIVLAGDVNEVTIAEVEDAYELRSRRSSASGDDAATHRA